MFEGPRRGPYRSRLRVDPYFYLELQFCDDNGLPHSALLEWEMEDRAKMIALRLERNERCQMCGTAEWEWDPAKGGYKFAYEPMTHICKGCAIKETAAEDTQRIPGASVVLRPTRTREWAKSVMLREKRRKRDARESREDRREAAEEGRRRRKR